MFKISHTERKHIDLQNEITWKDIHQFDNGDTSSCTDLAVYDTDIVTVGEDGCINLLSVQSSNVLSKKSNQVIFVVCFLLLQVIFRKCRQLLTQLCYILKA